MNDTIINSLNNVVAKHDTLIHLGDFAFGNKQLIPELRFRIVCRNIILILGNHDRCITKHGFETLFAEVHKGNYLTRVNGVSVHMNHFPLAVWDENGRGSVHLYGHCHGSFQGEGRCMDVGVDCWNFQPIPLNIAIRTCMEKDIVAPDHHDARTNYR